MANDINKERDNFGRMMSGATIMGVPEEMKPNANVENGEFLKFPDGSIAQALGERHINGGVDVILPDLTQVLSKTQDMKLKPKDVKKIQKKYEMKNVSTNDMYSSVLAKYGKKIGYEKLLKEEEDLFNAVKRNSERALSEGSLRINNDYLAKKIYEVQKKKAPLAEKMSEMFNDLFISQEKSKGNEIPIPTNALQNMGVESGIPADLQLQAMSDGQGRLPTENPQQNNAPVLQGMESEDIDQEDALDEKQVFALGGMYDDFKDLAKKNGYSLMDAYKILSDNNVIPKYAGGVTTGGGVFKSNAKRYSKDDFFRYQNDYNNLRSYQYGELNPMANRLRNLLLDIGIEDDNSIKNIDLSSLKSMDAVAGRMQNALMSNYRAIVEDYSGEMPPTNAGLKYLLDNKIISLEDMKAHGISPNNPAGMILGKKRSDLNESDIKGINDYIKSKLNDNNKEGYYKANFIDNKWDYRAPEVKRVSFESQEDLDKSLDGYQKLSDGTYKSKKTGLYIIPEIKDKPAPPTTPLQPADEQKNTTVGTEPGKTNDAVDNTTYQRQNRYFQMPDQSFIPPLSLQPESLYLSKLGRIDPVAIGIEDTLRRNQEQAQFVGSQVQNLPPTVSAGIMANAIAQNQMSENQAIDNTHAVNAANVSQAEQFNLHQADLEQSGNNAARLDYEHRALLGLSKTDTDLRNYYNAMRDVNINKFKEQQYMNTLANLFPKFTIDGSATGVVFDPTNPEFINLFGGQLNRAYQQSTYSPSSGDNSSKSSKGSKDDSNE